MLRLNQKHFPLCPTWNCFSFIKLGEYTTKSLNWLVKQSTLQDLNYIDTGKKKNISSAFPCSKFEWKYELGFPAGNMIRKSQISQESLWHFHNEISFWWTYQERSTFLIGMKTFPNSSFLTKKLNQERWCFLFRSFIRKSDVFFYKFNQERWCFLLKTKWKNDVSCWVLYTLVTSVLHKWYKNNYFFIFQTFKGNKHTWWNIFYR